MLQAGRDCIENEIYVSIQFIIIICLHMYLQASNGMKVIKKKKKKKKKKQNDEAVDHKMDSNTVVNMLKHKRFDHFLKSFSLSCFKYLGMILFANMNSV